MLVDGRRQHPNSSAAARPHHSCIPVLAVSFSGQHWLSELLSTSSFAVKSCETGLAIKDFIYTSTQAYCLETTPR